MTLLCRLPSSHPAMNERTTNIDGFLGGNRSEARALIQDLGLAITDIKFIGGEVTREKKEGRNGRTERSS